VIRYGDRNLGIGTEMMKTLIEQARAMNLKPLTLGVYATNQHAHHVHQTVGFVGTGWIPRKFFKDGQFTDEIVMAKVLD
jgi:RimJ/RimL family protein N-acetyltransferase